jgi:hypothetical protein
MGKKQLELPLETLFNLDGEWSVNTILECHVWKTNLGSPPPKKGINKFAIKQTQMMRTLYPCLVTKGHAINLTKWSMVHPLPLVLRKVKMGVQLMVDSHHQLPSLVCGEGTATSVKWSVRVQAQDQ